MFNKILIANRGEIACQIIHTANYMGVKTVAVYSDADANAMHVELADEAVNIGPAAVNESYLVQRKIIEAALKTGAQAIHPGYGFLSENPDFVEVVEAAGLTFIGPSAKAIRAMGLKDNAKALMAKAGVPIVPGYHGEAQEQLILASKANEIGYPVLIKARAGGGGKGMRRVDDPKDFASALTSARREAKAAFGDDRVLVEKYITHPRHIEVQVFGDKHGNVVHLFERDCSLQRRHQKVMEEAPAPGMTEEMRKAMANAAVKAAKVIDYSGAGTIEFIVDGSNGLRPDGFWFMEMNTRLQVEHPVTVSITGEPLIEWQLRVAAGEPLPVKQEDIKIYGHSFEARLYAEDVPKGFLPATGTLQHLEFSEEARIDTGVRAGDVISPFYDPMIAKIITFAETREEALQKIQVALQDTKIAGTVTNLSFLKALCRNQDFASGNVDTGLIERNLDQLVTEQSATPELLSIAAVLNTLSDSDDSISSSIGAFSLWGERDQFFDFEMDGEKQTARISSTKKDEFIVACNDHTTHIILSDVTAKSCSIEIENVKQEVSFAKWENHIAVFTDDASLELELIDPLDQAKTSTSNSDQIIAPMPGLVRQIFVGVDQEVKQGESILVLEAMKMEHTLSAPRDGVVGEIFASDGAQVEDGTVLIQMKVEADD